MSEDEKELNRLFNERELTDKEILFLEEGELDILIANNDPLIVKYFSLTEEIMALIKKIYH